MAVTVRTIQVKRGNAADWTSSNPVLQEGEPGVEIDTGKVKFGNGMARWSDLPYSGASIPPVWGAVTGTISDQSDLQTVLDSKQGTLGYTPVPDTRTVNGHALSGNVTVTKSDVGLGSVD